MTRLYNVASILDHRVNNNISELFVKWEGYSDSYNTWEPYVNFTNNTVASKYILDNELIVTLTTMSWRVDDEVTMEL